MSGSDEAKHAQGLPERVLGFLTLISGFALLGLMILVTVSVVFRYLLNAPLLGSQELIQLGMVFVVMLAMPYTALTNQHIRVDILDGYLGRTGRYVADIIARIACLIVLYFLVQKSFDKALDAYEYEDVTNMIELPLWTAYAAIVAGMGAFMLVLLLQLYRQYKAGMAGHE